MNEEADSSGTALRGPRFAAFGHALSGTELWEARAASRGNARLGSKNAVSLSLRFGLRSKGFFSLVRVKPRHQNLRQGGESSGDHSIARQLVCRTGLAATGFAESSDFVSDVPWCRLAASCRRVVTKVEAAGLPRNLRPCGALV